jgi:UDP-N-acetylmuramyl pentapeptide phosphotransferase/UDP-N-acetylglucosamine-1-phosphate transferase
VLISALIIFTLAGLANLTAMPLIIKQLQKRNVLDVPNERSSHTAPTPRGGGIGIVGIWTIGILAGLFLNFVDGDGFIFAALGGVITLAFLGFDDDQKNLSPLLKLIIQGGIAAAAVWFSGIPLTTFDFPFVPEHVLGFSGWVFAWLWLVGFTNIFNFMDGANGLAGSQILFAGVAFSVLGIGINDTQLMLAGALVAGAALGFLKYNFPIAKVFMGDVGSLPAGFLLALMVLRAAEGPAADQVTIATPLLFIWPFLYDGAYTLINRIVHKRNPFRPHRSHLYQRVMIAGATHEQITIRYAAGMVVCSCGGFGMLIFSDRWDAFISLFLLGVSGVLTVRTVLRIRARMTIKENINE